MAANPKPSSEWTQKPASQPAAKPDACDREIDPDAPAGSPASLGAKSDCNGRPTTDDSVVEAMDEQGPRTPGNQGTGNQEP
ncbi:MAG TPA: hypothetical protein VHX60_08555 [Acidobacteriaceae bacterium]|jgi:hypothetical protein|nr:hypothetical protein [Acidobacteriaceae bacterium]